MIALTFSIVYLILMVDIEGKVAGHFRPAAFRILFRVPVATSSLRWLLVWNSLPVFGFIQSG